MPISRSTLRMMVCTLFLDCPRLIIVVGERRYQAALCCSLDEILARVGETSPAAFTDEERQAALDSFAGHQEALENCLNPLAKGCLA